MDPVNSCRDAPVKNIGLGGAGFFAHDPVPPVEIRVLVIEDDLDVGLTLQRILHRSGMGVEIARSGSEAFSLKSSWSPHVVLVDLELPDVDTETLLRWLAGQHDCGIIVVSGRAEEADRVLSLELGADDYITKPPIPRELVARIRAVHRRVRDGRTGSADTERTIFIVGECSVDLHSRQVHDTAKCPVDVTGAEFAVLRMLIEARGSPVSRENLSEFALHRPWQAEDRGVDQLVFGLRRKLSPGDDGRRLIQSIRNAGYALCPERGPQT